MNVIVILKTKFTQEQDSMLLHLIVMKAQAVVVVVVVTLVPMVFEQ
jgi:hypothetical protein